MTTSWLAKSTRDYFDGGAGTYDQRFTHTVIGRAERDAVWQELGRLFQSGQRILELNCGTGVDALYLARSGVKVLACDIAPRMIEIARQRLTLAQLNEPPDFRVLATEDIAAVGGEAPFDGAFSNFSGLNCVEDLSPVARNLARLLRPGAPMLLCMSGRFVPFEIAWCVAHGNPCKALRRFRRAGSAAHPTDDRRVKVQYPSVSTLVRTFSPEFRLRKWKGVGVTLPPAYFEAWARRFPTVLNGLARVDRWLGRFPVLRGIAGHVLLQFERMGT